MKVKPIALIILDGWGVAPDGDGNADWYSTNTIIHDWSKPFTLREL